MFRGGAISQQLFFVTKVSGYCNVYPCFNALNQHRVRHGRLVEQLRREQTQRCFCADGMLEFRSERHTEYVY